MKTEEEISRKMLESAKLNLRKLSFFGILEHQHDSQKLFEKIFNLKFQVTFQQKNSTRASRSLVLPSLE